VFELRYKNEIANHASEGSHAFRGGGTHAFAFLLLPFAFIM
jgi:hypothetical protein